MTEHKDTTAATITTLQHDQNPSAGRAVAIFIAGMLTAYLLAWVFSVVMPIPDCPPSHPVVHPSYPAID